MENTLEIGGSVVFVDPYGNPYPALITAVHGEPDKSPAINVVYVSSDQNRGDTFGRQIERSTSVVHMNNQSAHGMYYRQTGEQPKSTESAR